MSRSIQAQRRVQRIAGLTLLGILIVAALVADLFFTSALGDIARWMLFPGAIADLVISGNVHAGFGIGWLDILVEIVGSWLFWMLTVCLVIWLFSGKAKADR